MLPTSSSPRCSGGSDRCSSPNRSGVGTAPRSGRPRSTTMRVLLGIMSCSVMSSNSSRLPLRDGRVALCPGLLHQPVGDSPSVGGAHQVILVVAADDEVAATGNALAYMLALQLTAVGRRVSVDGDLVIADEVLGVVESKDRSTDA